MNAYDIEIVNDAAHAGEANHGWCFGLPPGIRPEQWPLDPDTGYPLMHGFTLLLPEDYRVHGPEIVALSFFSRPGPERRWTDQRRWHSRDAHRSARATAGRRGTAAVLGGRAQ